MEFLRFPQAVFGEHVLYLAEKRGSPVLLLEAFGGFLQAHLVAETLFQFIPILYEIDIEVGLRAPLEELHDVMLFYGIDDGQVYIFIPRAHRVFKGNLLCFIHINIIFMD